MSQNTSSQKDNSRTAARVYCILVNVPKKFTVLEKCLINILETRWHISDSGIAEIMCLKEADVPTIIEDIGKNDVQGDSTARMVNSDFSWRMPGVAVAAEHDELKISSDIAYEISKFLENKMNVPIPDKIRQRFDKLFEGELKDVKTYILKISFSDGKFQCDGDSVPEKLSEYLEFLFEERGGNIYPKHHKPSQSRNPGPRKGGRHR